MARTSKRSIDFYFNVSLIITFILFGLLLLSSCSILDTKDEGDKEATKEATTGNCEIKATVKDFTGLDGCGKMLELENGAKFIPFLFYGTQPLLEAYEYFGKAKDGTKVTFSYSKVDFAMADACMSGEHIILECIQPVNSTN